MSRVEIVEVGPRDGLQNEARLSSPEEKVALITACAAAGLPAIELGAFVSPKWVPQMADTDAVLSACPDLPGVRGSVLIPNLKGLEALMQAEGRARVQEVAVFVAASEGFSRANLNADIATTVARAHEVRLAAQEAGYRVRAYISCVTDCPFEGPTDPDAVARVAAALAGADTLSLGDTIGKGSPERVTQMARAVLREWEAPRVAGHFHDTSGQAIDNVAACLELGITTFDASVAGLGGCPYAPGAPGNLATEALVHFLHARGLETGVDEVALGRAVGLARGMREAA
ncbi:MAG: hydroxymethylglutaryl-CoA lyase [Pseudomonadota bacterium]